MVSPPICHNIYTTFFCLKCITKEGGGELDVLRLYIYNILVELLMHVHIVAVSSGLQSDIY